MKQHILYDIRAHDSHNAAVFEAAHACALLNDTLVLILTWIRTYETYRLAKEVGIHSISELILRDGKHYIVIFTKVLSNYLVLQALSISGESPADVIYQPCRILTTLMFRILLIGNTLQLAFNSVSFNSVRKCSIRTSKYHDNYVLGIWFNSVGHEQLVCFNRRRRSASIFRLLPLI